MTAALAVVGARLGQLIRLLASDSDGEVVAAARALGRTLASVDQDFHALARIVETSALSANRGSEDHRAAANWIIKNGSGLTPRERDFLHSMAHWRGQPSEAQGEWLAALFERVSRQAECRA
jgi:hypothetical protein